MGREGQIGSVWVLLKLISETQLSKAAEVWQLPTGVPDTLFEIFPL